MQALQDRRQTRCFRRSDANRTNPGNVLGDIGKNLSIDYPTPFDHSGAGVLDVGKSLKAFLTAWNGLTGLSVSKAQVNIGYPQVRCRCFSRGQRCRQPAQQNRNRKHFGEELLHDPIH
jgi:hypothetical protein